MLDRQKRLIEVYEYARKSLAIHTQTDFAKAIGFSRPVVSSAINGNHQYLTDNLFQSICNRWSGVFNIDYLLTGDGTLLLDTAIDQIAVSNLPDTRNQSREPIDQSSLVNAVIAAKDETINSLHRELNAKNQLIEILQQQLNDAKYRADRPVAPYGNFVDPSLIASEPDANK